MAYYKDIVGAPGQKVVVQAQPAEWNVALTALTHPETGADVPLGGSSDHNALTNLTVGDAHTQYAYLTGRVGGQTFSGGSGVAGTLTLSSTSNAAKGKVLFGTSAYDELTNRLAIGKTDPLLALDVVGDGNFTGTMSMAGGVGALPGFRFNSVGSATSYGPALGFGLDNAYNTIISISTLSLKVMNAAVVAWQTTADGNTTQLGTLVVQGNGISSIAGSLGLGITPTATIHIKAGTAAASSAPLKLNSGPVMTTPENGAFEYDGTSLFFTVGGVRRTVTLT